MSWILKLVSRILKLCLESLETVSSGSTSGGRSGAKKGIELANTKHPIAHVAEKRTGQFESVA